jgi:hypothetical protein
MKTAMQELIEMVDKPMKVEYISRKELLFWLNKTGLEKEKGQIKDAYNDGYFGDAYKYKDWEEYYNQTYNQNK